MSPAGTAEPRPCSQARRLQRKTPRGFWPARAGHQTTNAPQHGLGGILAEPFLVKAQQFRQRGADRLLVDSARLVDFLFKESLGKLAVDGVEAAMNQLVIDSDTGIINAVR